MRAVIDSHMHLINTKCFDKPTYDRLGQSIPRDTGYRSAGAVDESGRCGALCLHGQDMHKVWNSEFGEIAVETSYAKYPDFFYSILQCGAY